MFGIGIASHSMGSNARIISLLFEHHLGHTMWRA
jgi:hypothetical protein